MRGRSAEVDAVHGGFVGQTFVPQVLGQDLALENMAVFTVGAFLPLSFLETDGAALQRYRNSHRKRMVVIQE